MRLKYWYLRVAYFLGFKAHVYNRISGMIAVEKVDDWMIAVNGEAWDYQKVLIAKGRHECPSCFWATKEYNEHIAKRKGYCYERAQEETLFDRAEREYLHRGPNARPIQ